MLGKISRTKLACKLLAKNKKFYCFLSNLKNPTIEIHTNYTYCICIYIVSPEGVLVASFYLFVAHTHARTHTQNCLADNEPIEK